jgi:tetratricopeptide (TPR) repeat protein
MSDVNSEFLNRYQKLWDSDQTSRAFAPLSEAYRRNGNLQRALQICRQGLNLHPSFAGGWYQLAKIYNDRKEPEKAIDALKHTVGLAPENIQAHNMLADIFLELRQPKEALKSLKMVLLLNPEDSRAKGAIIRLESLTADEYDEESFQVGDPDSIALLNNPEDTLEDLEEEQAHPENYKKRKAQEEKKALEQTISLVDALLVRNEFTKAKAIILKGLRRFGKHSVLEARLQVIEQQHEKSFENESPEIIQPVPPRPERIRRLKIHKLEKLLAKFSGASNASPSEPIVD